MPFIFFFPFVTVEMKVGGTRMCVRTPGKHLHQGML